MKKLFFFIPAIVIYQISFSQTWSKLWGKNGELWDTTRLFDFTNAGYLKGDHPLPVHKKKINAKKYGFKGDGITDNTLAFRKALKALTAEEYLFIPSGIYVLSDTIQVSKSNISIRGEGPGKTVLLITKGLEELYPNYNLQNRNQSKWSWSGAMILFTNVSGSGIGDLTVSFTDNPWMGHDFHERGYNGIGFSNNAHDGWISNVVIKGADLGIWIDRSSHHITATKWVLDVGEKRKKQKLQGHHGVNIYGGYNLLEDFEIRAKFHHDLSVESSNSVYNVFRKGKGEDLCIDHHNHAQSHNLFTDLDLGIGSRPYYSGGNDSPRGICFNETFWNIRAEKELPWCNYYDTETRHSTGNVQVGIGSGNQLLKDEFGNWFEQISADLLFPRDLYKAQMAIRKKLKGK